MTKQKRDTAQRLAGRIDTLAYRLDVLISTRDKYPGYRRQSEASAIEWAIPVLEKYILDRFGYIPTRRILRTGKDRSILVRQLIERDGNICYLCGEYIPQRQRSIDHVVPLSKGGADDMSNYKLTHIKCNVDKGNDLIEEMRRGSTSKQEGLGQGSEGDGAGRGEPQASGSLQEPSVHDAANQEGDKG